ncbi:hypothetical protein STEG23_010724, partial [Scotinomys teguina]
MYLKYQQIPNSTWSEYEFLCSLQTCHETSRMGLLRLIAQRPEEAIRSLELELQMVASCFVVLGIKPDAMQEKQVPLT